MGVVKRKTRVMEDYEIGRKRRGCVPGAIINNNGYWYWRVKFPGAKKRVAVPLKMPGANHAMPATKSRRDALAAAWREWERVTDKREGHSPDGRTVNDICDAWCNHAKEYYKYTNGDPTSESKKAAISIRMFRNLYGQRFIGDLDHGDMLALRNALIQTGVSRTTVNRYLQTTKQMITWALDENLIRAQVKAELTQVSPLKRNRSPAPETKPITAVSQDVIDKTIAAMVPNTADMVRVHALTGMRPDEICSLEWDRIDTSQTPWVYRPATHKNAWRSHPRVILIGPRARAILEKYRAEGGFPFSPSRALKELLAMKRAAAVSPSRYDRSDPHAAKPGERWKTMNYTQTIRYACKRAETLNWSANRLRHVFATNVRRHFGIAAARAVLGHTDGSFRVTDMYSWEAAEEEYIKAAREAVEALG